MKKKIASAKSKAVTLKQKLHRQEWRDFQWPPEPETSPEEFELALSWAEERIARKRAGTGTKELSSDK